MSNPKKRIFPSSYWRYSPIAPEGIWIILALWITTLITYALSYFLTALLLFIFFIFCLQFFRNPFRKPPECPKNHILSSADGKVIYAGPAQDPYLKRDCLKVSVFMNIFNVHANYAPIAGKIINKWHFPGTFFNASLDKSSENNERCMIHLRTDDSNQDIVFVQIAGLIARRIICYPEINEHLTRAQRYGFIRFGSRLDLYLPTQSLLKVKVGDHVKAGYDIIAIMSYLDDNLRTHD